MLAAPILLWPAVAAVLLLVGPSTAQTSSECNPTTTTCAPVTALGMAIDVDFTKGPVNSFRSSGGTPTYGRDGVTFTITAPGDAPQLNSGFYIMFGRVEITMRAAPGTGIVSSVVLQSDALDEIDLEFLGVRGAEVQTMYFAKGQTPPGGQVIVPTPANQAAFVTYALDWSADRIIWEVAGTQVRVLEASAAAAGAAGGGTPRYPQTPMQLKFGAWAGGAPGNAPGTVQWAGGPTAYAAGPFAMTVQRVAVADYSTGTQYAYGPAASNNGTWQSIQSVGGRVNAHAATAGAAATAIRGAAPQTTGTGFPASGIAGTGTSGADITIPSGWHMNAEGQIRPNRAAARGPPGAILAGTISFFILAAVCG